MHLQVIILQTLLKLHELMGFKRSADLDFMQGALRYTGSRCYTVKKIN